MLHLILNRRYGARLFIYEGLYSDLRDALLDTYIGEKQNKKKQKGNSVYVVYAY